MARLPRNKLSLAAVFAVTVIVVVAVAAAGPIVSPRQTEAPEHPEFAADRLVPARTQALGSIEAESMGREGTVLIDMTHGNRITKDQLEPFAAAIRDTGWSVEYAEVGDDFGAELSRADALVVIDPGTEYQPRQVDRVQTFVDNGGRLMLVGEPTQSGLRSVGFFVVLVPQQSNIGALAAPFGISFGESHLFNMERNDGNFKHIFAASTGDSDLTEGVDETTMYVATTVRSEDGTRLLEASDGTRLDRTGSTGDYPIAIVDGNVLAVGDKTFLERSNYKVADNARFLGNAISFLTAADRSRTLLDYPAIVARSPTIRYTSVGLLDAAQSVSSNLKETRPGQPRIALETDRVQASDTDVLVTTFEYIRKNPGVVADIEMSDGTLSVPGYESNATGVYVIHRPAGGGFDIVIAGDNPDRVEAAAEALIAGEFTDSAISDSTVVVRTEDAEPVDDDQTDDADEAETGPVVGGA